MSDARTNSGSRSRILHLSADFPDPIDPQKTPVIDRLIDLVANDFDHQVFSINRRNPDLLESLRLVAGMAQPADDGSVQPMTRGHCLEYLAPSRGLLHATMLDRLAAWIAERVSRQDARPDLVVGHKLTVEGMIAREVARHLGVPFAITIQGNTDQKILGYRPDLRHRFRQIYREAACVFSFAPWGRRAVERHLGRRDGLTLDLPCPTVFDVPQAPRTGGKSLLSVFHLRNRKIKNLDGMASAMQILAGEGLCARLEIVGGGSPDDMAACQAIAGNTKGLALVGPRTQRELGTLMNEAIALVLPSRRESFGLVFIEALFAGLPVIYPKGASIDGYFDGVPFAIPVDAGSPRAIAAAIRHAITEEATIKAALHTWQAQGGLERFSRDSIRAAFAKGLHAAASAGEYRPGIASSGR